MKKYLGLGAVLLGLAQSPAVFAQGCGPTGCLPPLGGVPAHSCTTCQTGRSDCGLCGLKQSPLLEKRYIRQFCRPTIAPDSCFGYHKTQWSAWTQACPNWGPDLPHPGPYMFQRNPNAAPAPQPTPNTTAPAPAPMTQPMNPMPQPMNPPASKEPAPLPKPPTTGLPTPKEMKEPTPPTFPAPKPADPLPKPPTLPPAKSGELPKIPPSEPASTLPGIPTIPVQSLPSNPF